MRRDTLTIHHLADLPSRGDTCFPSIVSRGPNEYLLYNYSSDIKGEDVTWFTGQIHPTFIYAHTLRWFEGP